MSFNKGPLTLLAGADLAQKILVKLVAGEVVVNTASDIPIGVSDYAVDDTENASISTLNVEGTLEMVAADAISLDADVFAAADGKISVLPTTGGTYTKVGVAMEAATADEDIIEVLPNPAGEQVMVVTALTTTAPVIVPGSVNTIDSTSNAVGATLADDTVIGRETTIVMTESSNSSTVTIASHETEDSEVATFDAIDEVLVLKWSGTEYVTIYATATFV